MAEPRPAPQGSTQAWRDGPAHPAAHQGGRSRRRRLVLTAAGLLALAGAAAALLFFLHPWQEPFFLTIPVTEYADPLLPPNPFAEQDGDALLALFPEGRRRKAVESQQRDRLVKELDDLRNHREAVLVHLTAHARVRGEEVYVLPANANLGDPDTWLSLADILAALRRCPAPHKLLVLDITYPTADARPAPDR